MTTPDTINGALMGINAALTWNNVWVLLRDKCVQGTSIVSVFGYSIAAVWGIYYLASLNQWISAATGTTIALADVTWLALAFRYGREG